MYDIKKSVIAQKELCEREGLPHFAPSSGVCWRCGTNIYEPHVKKIKLPSGKDREYTVGITTESAGENLVTGCPHCNRSYCD